MSKRSSSFDFSDIVRRMDGAELKLGFADPDDSAGLKGGALLMPFKAREAHMHVIGLSRSGKSRFLASLIQQDIEKGYGVCLIDPHGELYELIINWLAQDEWLEATNPNIHPVTFDNPSSTFRFNPLRIRTADEAYSVSGRVVEALTRIYGGKDSSETPRFARILDTICTTLAVRELPLAAADFFLTDSDQHKMIRAKICEGVADERLRQAGLDMARMSPREFREQIESTANRLHGLLRNRAFRRMFSTTHNTIDFRRAMDDGHILLFNTADDGNTLLTKELNTIGSLIVNNIYAEARKRPPRSNPHPFMLYVDEVQNYVNNDIEDILNQSAKRRLYMTLSHQHMGQLAYAGELVFNGVVAGALIKVLFQVTTDDAEVFVDRMFADRMDFQLVKEKLKSPHVIGHELTQMKSSSKSRTKGTAKGASKGTSESHAYSDTEGESHSEGYSESDSEATSDSTMASASENLQYQDDSALTTLGMMQGTSAGTGSTHIAGHSSAYSSAYSKSRSRSTVDAYGTSRSTSYVESTQNSVSSGVSEALKPVIQWFSTTAHSLEEQRYDWRRRLSHQPERHGFIGVRHHPARGFTTLEIPDPLDIPEIEEAMILELQQKSPWISTAAEVPMIEALPEFRAIIDATPGAPTEPDNFMEPMDE